MSIDVINLISASMKNLGLKYKFMRWAGQPEYPYFTGEYQEIPNINEDGMTESTFLLTGFTRGDWLELEEAKEKIEAYFGKVGGQTVIADNGSAVAVFYSHSLVVPTDDAELKRIEINLTIKEWSVK